MDTIVGRDSSGRAGAVALVLGCACGVATVALFVVSLSASVNPPNWVRALLFVWLPVGVVGVPVAFSAAHGGSGRRRGTAGLTLLVVSLVAFVVLMVVAG